MGKCEPQNLNAEILLIFILSGYTFSVAIHFLKCFSTGQCSIIIICDAVFCHGFHFHVRCTVTEHLPSFPE